MKVVGKRRMSFKPKESENEIKGWKLHLTYEDRNVEGVAVDQIFVSDTKLCNGAVPSIGDEVFVYYNKYGRVESVEIV